MSFRHLVIAIVAIVLTACGAASTKQVRPAGNGGPAEEVVAANAKARWDAIIAKDYRTAYDYLTPGTRATTAYEAYRQRLLGAALRWTAAEVQSVECKESDVCRAEVYITYMLRASQPGMGEIEGASPVYEQWIRTDGRWYHLPSGATGR